MAIYEKRLKRYLPLGIEVIPDLKKAKNLSPNEIKKKEGALILKRLKSDDLLFLLDERGKSFNSIAFSTFMEQQLDKNSSVDHFFSVATCGRKQPDFVPFLMIIP